MKTILYLSIFLCLASLSLFAQNYTALENEVYSNNRNEKFDKSIAAIINFLNSKDVTPYQKYKAYLLKADTHKALFDYDKTLEALELGQNEGILSDKKEEVIANIKAEKALALFDIQKYKEAAVLMQELKASNYKNLELLTTAYIIMQDGYLDYLNGNYVSSEKKYNDAILFMKKSEPQNLPVIYGKKILLYAKMKNKVKALAAFEEGNRFAKNPKNLKYLLYMNESLRSFHEENDEWKLAEKTFHRVDSLRTMYNAEENNNKIALLEKDIEIQKKDHEISITKIYRNSLLGLCLFLLMGIYLAYKLYISNKEKSVLLEKENIRIHDELLLLTNSLNTQGFTNVDLSKFNLSERQLEIIELIRQGKTNKEIANTIFISENTVKYHLKTIYEILNIENRHEFFKLIKK